MGSGPSQGELDDFEKRVDDLINDAEKSKMVIKDLTSDKKELQDEVTRLRTKMEEMNDQLGKYEVKFLAMSRRLHRDDSDSDEKDSDDYSPA